MVEVPDSLKCVFSAQIEERDGSYIIEIPEQNVEVGDVEVGGAHRIAILDEIKQEVSQPDEGSLSHAERQPSDAVGGEKQAPDPPVSEGDTREVEIVNIGDQGDGIAKVERGFVVIVSDTEVGDKVTVKITKVTQNVAFADVIKGKAPAT